MCDNTQLTKLTSCNIYFSWSNKNESQIYLSIAIDILNQANKYCRLLSLSIFKLNKFVYKYRGV